MLGCTLLSKLTLRFPKKRSAGEGGSRLSHILRRRAKAEVTCNIFSSRYTVYGLVIGKANKKSGTKKTVQYVSHGKRQRKGVPVSASQSSLLTCSIFLYADLLLCQSVSRTISEIHISLLITQPRFTLKRTGSVPRPHEAKSKGGPRLLIIKRGETVLGGRFGLSPGLPACCTVVAAEWGSHNDSITLGHEGVTGFAPVFIHRVCFRLVTYNCRMEWEGNHMPKTNYSCTVHLKCVSFP